MKRKEKELHRRSSLFLNFVIPLRLERKTYCLEGSCSIQLSYGTDLYMLNYENVAKLLPFAEFTKKKDIYLGFCCVFCVAYCTFAFG